MKALSLAEDMKGIVEEIVSSYEASVQNTVDVFSTTHQILQNSILDTKQGNEKVTIQIRESLARNKSLRRKDFDSMMQGILSIQDEGEKEAKDLVNNYLNEQKEMSQDLRKGIRKFQDSFAKGEVQGGKKFQNLSKEILDKQDERKQEIASKLKDFQKEQQEMTMRLKELLAKGREIRIRDLKSMLKEFSARHEERMARQKERKEEVQSILGDFRKERKETGKNWQMMQKEMAQRRTGSPKADRCTKKIIPPKILVKKEKEV